MRSGVKFGDTSLKDTMLEDGLMDAINSIHMGITGTISNCFCKQMIWDTKFSIIINDRFIITPP